MRVTWPAAFILLACGRLLLPGVPSDQPGGGAFQIQEEERTRHRLTEYMIKARVPVLGDISHVGTFAIEEDIRANGDRLDKTFRIFGNSKPEMARKGKDYRGELKMLTRSPKNSQEDSGGDNGAEEGIVEVSSSGFFNKNGQIQAEDIVFSPDCAVCRRENGDEKRFDGRYGCLITALEYFSDREVAEGDVTEFPFILGGHPYSFKCEVGKASALQPYGSKVFPIDFTTYDGLLKDGRGAPLVKKDEGDIRLWLSKDGPFKNRIVRLKVKYAWYLTIHMDLYKAS